MNKHTIPTAIPHRDAHMNRVILAGTFKAMRSMGVSNRVHIVIMQESKDRIRRHDAEPAAWFTGPTREQWVAARMKRGEFKTYEAIGRALEGEEMEEVA